MTLEVGPHTSLRPVACRDCAHVVMTPRGKGRLTYTCALYGGEFCYPTRFGGACGPEAKGFKPAGIGAKVAPSPETSAM